MSSNIFIDFEDIFFYVAHYGEAFDYDLPIRRQR